MLHPSYTELMAKINQVEEIGEEPVINSRYSIVIATAKRARQLVDAENSKKAQDPEKAAAEKEQCQIGEKPLSIAVRELYAGDINILPEDYPFEKEVEETAEAEVEAVAEETAEEPVAKETAE